MRRPLVLLVVLAGLSASVPAARAADEAPNCYGTTVSARAGLARAYSFICQRTDDAVLVAGPAHGVMSNAVLAENRLRLEYTADARDWSADASSPPETVLDGVTIRLIGAGGERTLRVTIAIVPPQLNTAPTCPREQVTHRVDPQAPTDLSFQVMCTDAEGDRMTVTGTGPGTFTNAPLRVHPTSTSRLQYRPQTTAGEERATYTATDDLGAASDPAPLTVTVGPREDRLPSCRPTPAWYPDPEVFMRPGVPRRFALICEDPDGDPFTPEVRVPPLGGLITAFDVQPSTVDPQGRRQWVGVTYTPMPGLSGESALTVGARGAAGAGEDTLIRMTPYSQPKNQGASCGWQAEVTGTGEPVTASGTCSDYEGDDVNPELATPPRHGTATITTSRAALGGTDFVVRYTPEPGFKGVEPLTLRIVEGYNVATSSMRLEFTTRAPDAPAPRPVYLMPPTHTELSDDAVAGNTQTGQTGGRPAAPAQRPSASPASVDRPPAATTPAVIAAGRTLARAALRTSRVRLVAKLADIATVYTPTTRLRAASRRALAVACPTACVVTAAGRVGRDRSRAVRVNADATHAAIVPLSLSRAERRSIARSGRATVRYRLTVVTAAGCAATGTIRVLVLR